MDKGRIGEEMRQDKDRKDWIKTGLFLLWTCAGLYFNRSSNFAVNNLFRDVPCSNFNARLLLFL